MTRCEHKDEELEIRGGIAGEEDAVLAVADGALDLAEFRVPVSHLQAKVDRQEQQGGGDVKAALGGGGAEIVAEDEFEIGEAVVAAHRRLLRKKSRQAA